MASLEKIMKKLKNHPQHKQKSQKELERLARELTNTADMKGKFDNLLQVGQEMAQKMIEEENDDPLHTLQRIAEHKKVKHDTARACHLPIQLSLQKLSALSVDLPGVVHKFSTWLNFEYGAFHAVLTVGNIAIDWGRESIVEPRHDPLLNSEFLANVGDQSEWLERQGICQKDISLADRERNSDRKLEILCESMTEKAKLVENLVDVIVDYNQNKWYSVRHCNCQDFVRDAMAALGIHKPVKFQGNLQRYFERLKGSNVKIPLELKGHENLDVYVAANLQDLERQDMEYLQFLYFKAHLPALEKARDPDEWKCDIPTCMRDELDARIGMHALPFNQLLDTVPDSNQSVMEITLPKKVLPQQNDLQLQSQQIQISSQSTIRQSSFYLPLVSNENDKSSHVEQFHCINDCGMYGEQDSGGLCSRCLKKELDAMREKGRCDPQVKQQESSPDTNVEVKLHTFLPDLQEQCVSDNTLSANPGPKTDCRTYGCEFSGTKENFYYCSRCFDENTEEILREVTDHQEPQKNYYNCRQFFGCEEYRELRHTGFMEETKIDTRPQMYLGDNNRDLRTCDKEHTIGDTAGSGHMVQNSDSSYRIKTEPVPLLNVRSNTYSILNDEEDDHCYLCFDKQIGKKNPICDYHARTFYAYMHNIYICQCNGVSNGISILSTLCVKCKTMF